MSPEPRTQKNEKKTRTETDNRIHILADSIQYAVDAFVRQRFVNWWHPNHLCLFFLALAVLNFNLVIGYQKVL